jgi:spermidine/putrescine transport system permease protein
MISNRRAFWLVVPFLIWGFGLLVFPLLIIFMISFQRRGDYGEVLWTWSFQNYQNLLDSFFLRSFIEGLGLVILVATLCTVFSFPLAWALASLRSYKKKWLIIMVCVPFFANLIARIYAIKIFLNTQGPIQKLLGLSIFNLDQNIFVMIFGLVSTYLPLALFPIWLALEKQGYKLLEAALDLGATPLQAFMKVYIPILRGAIATGFLLVFIPVLGEFLIPDLLGGAQNYLIAHQLSGQFLKVRDWPMGSALAVVLVCILMGLSFLVLRLGRHKSEQ